MHLEAEIDQLRKERDALLDRLLGVSGIAPINAIAGPRAVPSQRPVRPWRRMAQMESEAQRAFDEQFPLEEILKEKSHV